jgi:hypothetical protein
MAPGVWVWVNQRVWYIVLGVSVWVACYSAVREDSIRECYPILILNVLRFGNRELLQ